jgi:hypothetical protein
MHRGRRRLLSLWILAALVMAGCSLVVDFDRSLLVDAGADAGEGGAGGELAADSVAADAN